jgi:hypothetical protein
LGANGKSGVQRPPGPAECGLHGRERNKLKDPERTWGRCVGEALDEAARIAVNQSDELVADPNTIRDAIKAVGEDTQETDERQQP